MRFENKVALVTASGAGIGRAIAVRLAAEGAAVMVSDVNDAAGAETVRLIVDAGGRADYRRADVSQDGEVAALVAATVDAFGGLHLAANNAGISAPPTLIQDLDMTTWERTVSVTLAGTFTSLKHEIAHMLAHGGGSIVNTASIAGLQATPNLAPYSAAKHGVVALTKAAAAENAAKGIRINAVAPGATLTAAFEALPPAALAEYSADVPMKRLGQVDEIADAFAFLLSDEASFITGVTLPVDGGTMLN